MGGLAGYRHFYGCPTSDDAAEHTPPRHHPHFAFAKLPPKSSLAESSELEGEVIGGRAAVSKEHIWIDTTHFMRAVHAETARCCALHTMAIEMLCACVAWAHGHVHLPG